jgi:hypothetical protein
MLKKLKINIGKNFFHKIMGEEQNFEFVVLPQPKMGGTMLDST